MNISHKIFPLLCATAILFFQTSRLHAQKRYTLDECVEMALQNNARIKNADNDLRAAEQAKKSAFTNYFPTVSASGAGFVTNNALLQLELMPGQGMSIAKNGIMGGVTALMPLSTGGQIINGNRLAETNVEVKRLQRRQSEEEVRLTVEQYFWQAVLLKEKLRTLDAVQEQLNQIHRDVEAAVNAGVTNRNDQLQVQLRKNEMRSNCISAGNALRVSLRLLAQYIGSPADSINVALNLDGSLPASPEGLYRSPETSLDHTTAYQLLSQNVDASRLQYKMAIGKNLPTTTAGGGFLYENLMDKDHSFWIGGLTISIPLSQWWRGSHEIKQQKLQVRNAENLFEDQSELLLIRMENTWNAVTNAYQQVKIAIESIAQAQENLRLQSDYYQAGICTISDLLEAQTLYRQSRDKYVESYAQYEIKKREYLQATGQ